jgi:hypothetical protein
MDLESILASMTLTHWFFIGLLWLGLFTMLYLLAVRYSTRYADDWEVKQSPELLYETLRQRPDCMPPAEIVKVLGCEGTLNLLTEGDTHTEPGWRYRWAPIREGLLSTLSEQNAYAPVEVLSRYYGVSRHMRDSVRIRRTVLVHKLGRALHVEPGENGTPACLVVQQDETEEETVIDFPGQVVWRCASHSENGSEPLPLGPVIELGPIRYLTDDCAELEMQVRRGPLVGGGFQLRLERRRGHWIVVRDYLVWAT